MTIYLKTNWTTKDEATKQAVSKAKSLLDSRVKAIKDASESDLERVLTGFFAYGGNGYQIILDKVPEADRALLSACRDSLVGEVLQRTSGRNGFKLKKEWLKSYQAETLPVPGHVSQGRIVTAYGSTITDDSYNDIPVDQIVGLNFAKSSFIRVPYPNTQTDWLWNGSLTPRWNTVEPNADKEAIYNLDWDMIRDRAIFDNRKTMIPFGKDGIICSNVDGAIQALYIATLRVIGKPFRYFVEWRDTYGRTGTTWGMSQASLAA